MFASTKFVLLPIGGCSRAQCGVFAKRITALKGEVIDVSGVRSAAAAQAMISDVDVIVVGSGVLTSWGIADVVTALHLNSASEIPASTQVCTTRRWQRDLPCSNPRFSLFALWPCRL